MEEYAAEIEGKMKRCFSWLAEKDRRRYAAIEAAKLGHGGIEDIARVLACDPKTIRQGLRDLEEGEDKQHLDNLRRKDLLPRLKNDRSICLLGRLFCLKLCRSCLLSAAS